MHRNAWKHIVLVWDVDLTFDCWTNDITISKRIMRIITYVVYAANHLHSTLLCSADAVMTCILITTAIKMYSLNIFGYSCEAIIFIFSRIVNLVNIIFSTPFPIFRLFSDFSKKYHLLTILTFKTRFHNVMSSNCQLFLVTSKDENNFFFQHIKQQVSLRFSLNWTNTY